MKDTASIQKGAGLGGYCNSTLALGDIESRRCTQFWFEAGGGGGGGGDGR